MFVELKERMVLQWHITHACNLRCRHCYQEEYQSDMPKEQLLDILEKYTEFINKHDYMGQINLTGGEPLLHPYFFELSKEIKKRGIRLGILTNGTLIDQKCARKLKALNPLFVQVSVDGIRKTHDKIRGDGAYKKTMKAIRYLKKNKIRVLVSFTAQKNNYQEFEKIARVCKWHRVDKLWWDRVVTESEEEKNALALTTEEFHWLVKKSGELSDKYSHKKGIGMVTNQRALQFLGCEDKMGGYQCSAGKTLLAVLADGTVMPCRRLPFVVGNILESDFDEILNSHEVLRELRKFLYPKECKSCKHLIRCKGGARCVTYGQTGNLYAKDVNCKENEKVTGIRP